MNLSQPGPDESERLAIRRADGQRVICEDLRNGCAALVNDDGVTGQYRFLDVVTSTDVAP